MNDRIAKTIELKAPVARVWHALTDHEAFGAWFRVKLDSPFAVGEVTRGQVTYPGHEHLKWEAEVTVIQPQEVFAFTWQPYDTEPDSDRHGQPSTQVEFRLTPTAEGTRLDISESGFSKQPDEMRRMDAFRRNTDGWNAQAENIRSHVES